MTDNEIIKALDELMEEQENGYVAALECGGKRDEAHEGFLDLLGATIDFINRQQAEIAELQHKIERLNFENLQMIASIKRLKAEEIKEFEGRVLALFPSDKNYTTISRFTVKQITKEMVGENNG